MRQIAEFYEGYLIEDSEGANLVTVLRNHQRIALSVVVSLYRYLFQQR